MRSSWYQSIGNNDGRTLAGVVWSRHPEAMTAEQLAAAVAKERKPRQVLQAVSALVMSGAGEGHGYTNVHPVFGEEELMTLN